MLYFTGEGETIESLKKREEYQRTSSDYLKMLKQWNPRTVPQTLTETDTLRPYLPLYLVTQTPKPPFSNPQAVSELLLFSLSERKTLREIQETGYDIITHSVMGAILEKAQSYAATFRKKYDSPLISTPWDSVNDSLKKDSILEILHLATESTKNYVKNTPFYKTYNEVDKLYDSMHKVSTLKLELLKWKKNRSPEATEVRKKIKNALDLLEKEIAKELPKRLDEESANHYLHARYTLSELRKMREGRWSKKLSQKVMRVTDLDCLSREGFALLKRSIPKLEVIGKSAEHISRALDIGTVAYDAYDAYKHHGKVTRTLVKDGAGFATGAALGESTIVLGELTVGALVGDAGLLALCSVPVVGWVALGIIGIAETTYLSDEVSKEAGYLYDHRQQFMDEISKAANGMYQKVASAWRSGSSWLLDFYGHNRRREAPSYG